MITTYRGTVQGVKWPEQVTVQASGWPTAFARAAKEFKKKQSGKHLEKMSIVLFKVNGVATNGGDA